MTAIIVPGTVFTGADKTDVITALANDVGVIGLGGDDWLSAVLTLLADENGSTTLLGGEGDDHLRATIFGEGATAIVSLDGGSGDDLIWAEFLDSGTHEQIGIDGGEGDDTILVNSDPTNSSESSFPAKNITSNVEGGAGADSITVTLKNYGDFPLSSVERDPGVWSNIDGGAGPDVISSEIQSVYGPAVNVVSGGAGDDLIHGRATTGGDFGESALNQVHGGDGDDEIDLYASGTGMPARNEVWGDDGNDRIVVEARSGWELDPLVEAYNDVRGGEGNDTISARVHYYGDDYSAEGASNTLYGNSGNDRLTGIVAGTSPDGAHSELYGGEGNDRLSVKGGEGNRLEGNQGDDVLLGGSGSDRLIGGQGDDYLRGRGGEDFFVFGSIRAGERDRIVDFVIGEDTIDLSGIDARVGVSGNQAFAFGTSHGTGRAWIEQSSGSSSILHADNGRNILEVVLQDGRDIGPGDYSASDFIL